MPSKASGYPQTFGDALQDARHRSSLTQRDLAELVGVTPGFVSRVESGKRWPTLDVLRRWVAVLGVRVVVSPHGFTVEMC